MHDVNALVDRYFAVWNETDPDSRLDLIVDLWSDDATYLDPFLEGNGATGINDMVTALQQQFPGHRFRLSGTVDHHHDRLRFGWELVDPRQIEPVIEGIDFGVMTDDGRLLSVTGFVHRAPMLGIGS